MIVWLFGRGIIATATMYFFVVIFFVCNFFPQWIEHKMSIISQKWIIFSGIDRRRHSSVRALHGINRKVHGIIYIKPKYTYLSMKKFRQPFAVNAKTTT